MRGQGVVVGGRVWGGSGCAGGRERQESAAESRKKSPNFLPPHLTLICQPHQRLHRSATAPSAGGGGFGRRRRRSAPPPCDAHGHTFGFSAVLLSGTSTVGDCGRGPLCSGWGWGCRERALRRFRSKGPCHQVSQALHMLQWVKPGEVDRNSLQVKWGHGK
jgi:hypothetical protein